MQERFPFCLFLFEALLRFRQRRHEVIPRIELAAAAVVALGTGVGNHIPGQLVIHRVAVGQRLFLLLHGVVGRYSAAFAGSSS